MGKRGGEIGEHGVCEFGCFLHLRVKQRQQAFRQPCNVPLGDARLIVEGVAPLCVDGGEHLVRIVFVKEGAWTEVYRLAGDRHIVGIHHAVDEAYHHPAGDEFALPLGDALQQGEIGIVRVFTSG